MSLRLTNLRVAVLAAASVVVPGVRDATLAAGASGGEKAVAETGARPPIPIRFTLPEPAHVTLVIEDAEGQRVRNLVGETPFPAGENVAYWDGLDDLGRDPDAAAHAIYHIPGRLVGPGAYQVRGLYRKGIDLRYEFTVYNPGDPPWRTKDSSSEWLTNHTPPSAVCFVPAGAAPARPGSKEPSPPQVLAGSFVAEGGSGLAWLDLGGRKLHGQMWIGGIWTAATQITRDAGDKPVPGVYAYTGAAWEGDGYNKNQPELRLYKLVNDAQKLPAPRDTRMGTGEDLPVLNPNYKFPDKQQATLGGLAARNGLLVAGLTKMNALLLIDVAAEKVLGTSPLEDPRGLAFDAKGRLLALCGKRLLRFDVPGLDQLRKNVSLSEPKVIVAAGLDDPQQIALDDQGNIYVSDRGQSHQVKVFAPEGKPLRAIGTAGAPKAGRYDPNHINQPKGITVSGDGHLWVAEEDFQPKRVSVWTLDGKLVRAFYGPPVYGGGGVLDPRDKTLFYLGGMTFKLDWQQGAGQLICIHHRPGPSDLQIPGDWGGGTPETPIYFQGRKYFTNCYTTHPTNGAQTAYLWLDRDGLAVPIAALGKAKNWKLLQTEAMKQRLPEGVSREKPDWDNLLFAWSDLNGDAQLQPEEVSFVKGSTGSGIIVAADLSMITGKAIRFAPQKCTAGGVPVYDLAKGDTLVADPQDPTSSGGGQVFTGKDGWTVLTVAPKPFAPQSVGGAQRGKARWSYPSVWPGLHASHIAAMPEFPGELIGTTRLLGPTVAPRQGEGGEIWAVNGNKGNIYLLTTDGLFVATLFQDCRNPGASWSMPKAERGMSLNGVTNSEESFWPSITQTADGNVYVVTNWPSIIRVEGLEGIRRIPPTTLNVTPEMLAACRAHFLQSEAIRQEKNKTEAALVVPIRRTPPTVDGKLDDWSAASWVTIDVRSKQQGDWGRSQQKSQAAVCVAGDRLYAAFKTGEPAMLRNSGKSLPNLFKTGGALDLMLGADPKADPKRRRAVAGDVRLLAAQADGKPVAVLYRPVAPGATSEAVPFSSPLRTVAFDRVEEVTKDVTLAGGPDGSFELSIPLAVLGLKPAPGLSLRGDVGLLRGNGFDTVHRVYWTNKATGLTSDIPSEAELTPHLWGTWEFKEE